MSLGESVRGFLGRLGGALEPRYGDPAWLTRDDSDAPLTGSGVRVTTTNAMRLSTVWACVRLLSNTIATLPTEIIVQLGATRFPEFQKPSWLTNPNPADPSMTPTEYFAQLTTSLLLEGNFFVYCPYTVMDPSVLIVLNPAAVTIKRSGENNLVPTYEVRGDTGQVTLTTDAMHMLHGVWMRLPGSLRGLSPIDAARQGIGSGLAAEDFAGRYFGHGSALSFGVEVPGALNEPQKAQLRDALRESYAGLARSHSVGVLTGGAKFITGLGVTNEQAQFLETRKFTVEDIAGRIYGVPPHMVGSQEPGASSYSSVEQRSLEFRTYSLLALVRRIEDPHQRLVEPPAAFRGRGATATFRINVDGLARADLKSRYEAYSVGTQGGILKPNEARALEDLPPVPGGDVTYMQAQYLPLGSPPAPPPPPALPPARSEDFPTLAALMNGHQSVINVTSPPVTVTTPPVNVTTPVIESPAPELLLSGLDRRDADNREAMRAVMADNRDAFAAVVAVMRETRADMAQLAQRIDERPAASLPPARRRVVDRDAEGRITGSHEVDD